MKAMLSAAILATVLLAGCQSAQGDNYAANTDLGEAQRTTGQPSYGRTHDGDVTASDGSATAATTSSTVTSATAVDCSKDIEAKSQGAVGNPCETTVQFIDSLNLTAAQKRKALNMVRLAH